MTFRCPFRFLIPTSALVIALTSVSCVGRGKYLNALQSSAEASSEAASAKTDYTDAMLRVERLERNHARLLDSLAEQSEIRLSERRGSIDERQQLVNRVTIQGLLIDSLQTERDRLHRQRNAALAIVEQQSSRMAEVQSRIVEKLPANLPSPPRIARAAAELLVYLPETALFTERRTPAVSQAGDELLTALAAALGGQPDLRIEVAAEPRDFSGSPAARLEAGRRAAIVVSNLVEGHGLDPAIVAATSLQSDAVSASLAPAEAGGMPNSTQLRVSIRIAGDHVAQISGALRN